jgi:hypothetical protein
VSNDWDVEDYLNKVFEHSRERRAEATNVRFKVAIKIKGEWVAKRNTFSDEDDAYAFCVGLMHTNKDAEDYKILVSNPYISKYRDIYSAQYYYPKFHVPYLDEMYSR